MAIGLVSTSRRPAWGQTAAPPAVRLTGPAVLWMTGEATGQPGPTLEHVIQTRR
jgi:hypothetical protein